MSRPSLLFVCTLATAALLGSACDDPPKSGAGAASASASAAAASVSATDTAPAPRPKPTTMPELIVDTDGPYLDGQRVKLGEPESADKLAKIIKNLPIDGKPVTLQVDKKAKTSHVAAVVAALGDAGAPKVTIKTDGRNDLAKEIAVTPQGRVTSAPACSVVAAVLKDFSTALWPIKGGTARKQRKGLAGPDFSHTQEQLEKDLAACDSTDAFFSGDDGVAWESIFNVAGTILVSDKKKRIDTVVLLTEEPVAGRAVTLGKH
jgi:biopolymer transport protein ExbD